MCAVQIGVTSADDPTPDNYLAAVRRVGAEPLIFHSVLERVERDLDAVSGVLITGGTDIAPDRYGAAAHDKTDVPDTIRDAYEVEIARRATERGIPLLMICRGMQIANVAFGGTLNQHLPDIVDGKVVHSDMARKFEAFDEHIVTAVFGSLLATTVGTTRFATNASHHQSVARIGIGLIPVALTDDGIVEALELPTARAFWLATQWHPERLLDADDGRSVRLFAAFVEAAANYQSRREISDTKG